MKTLTSTDSLDELLTEKEHSLLYFTASWCGPCKSMSPIIEGVSNTMSEQFNTIKIDVDNSQNEAADYGIRSVPTLMLVKEDEIIGQQVGLHPPQQLIKWLEQLS
jgi:thioredoxin 1